MLRLISSLIEQRQRLNGLYGEGQQFLYILSRGSVGGAGDC